MNHTVNSFFKLHEGTVRSQVSDFATYSCTRWVVMSCHIPRINLELSETKRNFLVIFLNTKNNRVHFISDIEYFAGFGNSFRPRHFSDMNKTLDTFFQFNESTVWNKVNDFTTNLRVDWELTFNFIPWIA